MLNWSTDKLKQGNAFISAVLVAEKLKKPHKHLFPVSGGEADSYLLWTIQWWHDFPTSAALLSFWKQ